MRTVISLAAALVVSAPLVCVAQSPMVALEREAKREAKGGSVEAACAKYQKLVFAGHRKARSSFLKLRKKQVKRLLQKAKRLRTSDPTAAVALLKQAYDLLPSKAVTKQLKRHGLTYAFGEFLTKAGLKQARAREKTRGVERRRKLGLAGFALLRRGAFRFYTNIDVRKGKSAITQMMNAVEAHYLKFCEVMRPAGIRYPKGGLDVVLFKNEADYQAHVKSPGSVGVYDPRTGAGYFFAGGSKGFDFPTLLHEMTHQLNDKVLNGMGVTPWFEEGIAEYFGAATFTHAGRRIQLGRPEPDRLEEFRDACIERNSPVKPLGQLFTLPEAKLGEAYYAQSWALVHYLMTGPVRGKLIVFDLIAAGKTKQTATKNPDAILSLSEVNGILKAYGLDADKLETAYRAHYGKR